MRAQVVGGRRVKVTDPGLAAWLAKSSTSRPTAPSRPTTCSATWFMLEVSVATPLTVGTHAGRTGQRRHRTANEPVGRAVEDSATSTSKSAISCRFVADSATALAALMAQDESAMRWRR
jgi:hypothetical protein